MINDRQGALIEREIQTRLHFFAAEQRSPGDVVERGAAHYVYPPWLLSHADHPLARAFGRGQMNVAELGKSISNRLIDGSQADMAALDVRDGDSQSHANGGRSQH